MARAARSGSRVFESPIFWVVVIALSFSVPLVLSLRRPQLKSPPVIGELRSFELKDQNDHRFPDFEVRGIVSIFSFVDLQCGAPCEGAMERLYRVQKSLKGAGPTVRLVSITVNPAQDTLDKLLGASKSYNTGVRGWTFATGDIQEIARVAANVTGQAAPDLHALAEHATVALVDQAGHIRARRELRTDEDVNQTILDVAVLINSNPPSR